MTGRLETGEKVGDTAIRDMIAEAKKEAQRERAEAKLTPAERKRKKQRETKQQADRAAHWEAMEDLRKRRATRRRVPLRSEVSQP